MARTAEHREVARCLHGQETDLRFYRGVRRAEAFTSMHKREVRQNRHRSAAGTTSGSGVRWFGAARTSGRHARGAGSNVARGA
jgi:hypothetical protein